MDMIATTFDIAMFLSLRVRSLQRLALQPPLMTARLLTGNAPMYHRVKNAPESAVG
jgi:hypothetical protein